MIYETPWRSLTKAVSWRLLGSLATMALVFAFTRRIDVTLSVGALEFVGKIAFFFAHERAWNALPWGRKTAEPFVLWFTGLPGAGKSTMAQDVARALRERGLKIECLDGDAIRGLFPETGFSRGERDMHVRRVGHLASMLEKNGVSVVAAFISPYASSRAFIRGLCRNFIEVHVATPLAVCEARDPKGLYRLARAGQKPQFTGVGDPYEPPERCELTVDTSRLSPEQASSEVMRYLDARRAQAR